VSRHAGSSGSALAEPVVFDPDGHALAYDDRGGGPPVVLIHGLMSSRLTWTGIGDRLSAECRVIAVDLPGHGRSGEPAGDYSLGAHAAAVRDLVVDLGLGPVTLVGHSYGGGVALQFAYLFPELVARLVLVSSGGLGREVSLALRVATLPGSEFVLPVLASAQLHGVGDRVLELWRRAGLPRVSAGTKAAWNDLATLAESGPRRTFLATSRAVIDVHGQRVSAIGRLDHFSDMPTLWISGGHDRIIPAFHAVNVGRECPSSTVVTFETAGHFPHLDEPERFARVLSTSIDSCT
jgi:pimeloyl-ACP methyl ester carboxylesterase